MLTTHNAYDYIWWTGSLPPHWRHSTVWYVSSLVSASLNVCLQMQECRVFIAGWAKSRFAIWCWWSAETLILFCTVHWHNVSFATYSTRVTGLGKHCVTITWYVAVPSCLAGGTYIVPDLWFLICIILKLHCMIWLGLGLD